MLDRQHVKPLKTVYITFFHNSFFESDYEQIKYDECSYYNVMYCHKLLSNSGCLHIIGVKERKPERGFLT